MGNIIKVVFKIFGKCLYGSFLNGMDGIIGIIFFGRYCIYSNRIEYIEMV